MKAEILGLGKDSIIYGVGSVVTRSIALITLPLFTAYLTPEEYGVLAMLALLAMIAYPVFSLGLSAAMGPSYFDIDDDLNKSKVVWSAFLINCISASILVLLAWLFPVFLGLLVRLPVDYASLISVALTGTALTILVTSLSQRVQFEKQAKLYVYITISTAFTAILVSVYTVVFLGWGVAGMVYGQVAGNVVTFLAFFIIGIKATLPSVSASIVKELLRQGFPLVPSFAFLFFLMHANKYILEWHAGLDAVGIYSIGFNLGMAMTIVVSGISSAWYPFFMSYSKRHGEANKIFGKIFTYYTIIIGSLVLIFFISSKAAIMLLTHDNFHSANIVVGLVASSVYFSGMYSLFLPGMYFNKEVSIQSLVQAVAVIISLPLSFLFVIYFDILGAGISIAVGYFLMAVLTFAWNRYRKKQYLSISYQWDRIALFSFYFVLVAGFCFYVDFDSLYANIIFSLVGSVFVLVCGVQFAKQSEIEHVPYLRALKV